VTIYDLSPEGCRVEFVDRPTLSERLWVKLEGVEALEGTVCWIEGHCVGLQFRRPLHPAVFGTLLKRFRNA
jgi:hypothetical protein